MGEKEEEEGREGGWQEVVLTAVPSWGLFLSPPPLLLPQD